MITLRKPSAQIEHDYIYPGDDAIDRDRPDWEAELEAALESGDPNRLPLKPGAKPTIFTLRQPTALLRRTMQDIVTAGTTHNGGLNRASRKLAEVVLVRVRDAGGVFGTDHEFELVTVESHGFPTVKVVDMDILDNFDNGGLVDMIGLFAIRHLHPPKNS